MPAPSLELETDRIPDNEEILLRDEWFLADEEKESPTRTRPTLLESESFQFTIRPFTKRHNASGEGEDEEDYNEDRFSLVSIMEPTKPDLPVDLQRLSILWSHGNIFRAFPSPPTDIPGGVLPSPLSPSSPRLPVPAVGLHVQSPSTSASPITPMNCSTTWSVLEMYNTPESPPQIPSASSSDLHVHTPHQARRHLPFPSPSQQHQSPSPSKKPSAHPHPILTLDDMIPPLTLKKRSASVSGPRPIRPLPSIPRLEPPTMPNECSPRLPPPTTPNPPTPGQMIRGPRPRTKSNNSVRSITPTLVVKENGCGRPRLSSGRVIL